MKGYNKCTRPFTVSIGYSCRPEQERKIIEDILEREGFRHEFTPKKKYLKFFDMDEFDNFMLCLRKEVEKNGRH